MSQVPAVPVQNTQVVQPTAKDPVTAAGIASSQEMSLSSTTTISSVADLKKKAPKVYNAMMQGIAMNICNDMQQHQAHLKELMDEGLRRS